MLHTRRLITLSLFAVALLPTEAHAYRYLCTSVPSACDYVPSPAPGLKADVCYGTAIGIRLKGSAPCPSGSWPYFVEQGEVINPTTGQVAAYIPLDNACDMPGLCAEWAPHTGGQEHPICCDEWLTCFPGTTCEGTIWWCYDGVSNMDGSVTCFDAEEL